MVDEILDIEAHHSQAHPGEDLLQALQVILLNPIILTETDAWNHAGVGREVHDSAPDNLGRGFYVLNHQAPPPRSGGQLLFHGLAFSKFLDLGILEADARRSRLERLDKTVMSLGFIGRSAQEDGGEEEREEPQEEDGDGKRWPRCNHKLMAMEGI